MLDLVPSAIIAAALAPTLLLLWLVVAADQRPEPPAVVGCAFMFGAAGIFAVRFVHPLLPPLASLAPHPWLAIDQYALLAVAVPEETVKVGIIALIALRVRAFDEPMDGVVYGAAVGLGFAAHENLGYLFKYHDWQTLAITRGVLTVPFHAALGAIAGAYIAIARFGGALGSHRASSRARLLLLAWLIPVLLHGMFDAPLMALRRHLASGIAGEVALAVAAVAVAAVTFAIAGRLLVRIVGRQKVWPRHSRAPAGAWREVWLMVVIGAGLGFIGAGLMLSGARQWEVAAASSRYSFALGCLLVLAALAVYRSSSRYLAAAVRQRAG